MMQGIEGHLEEWQTQEVNVTRGEAEGDIEGNLRKYIIAIIQSIIQLH